ncbi:MAG: FAD-dependent oxidoreductase [Verrucomicrobia bacterium]|nr:FAD-dependent oxidoreductase [Verrucomicrobiota bacterium]
MIRDLDWCVIGAGPAGIAAVGKLIDLGVPPERIGWMDPHFAAGDFGRKWNRVPSNTKVDLFLRYLNAAASFEFKKRPHKFPLEEMNPAENCWLQDVVAPLEWVTQELRKKVQSFVGEAMALSLYQNRWEIKTKDVSVHSKNVILATGSETKGLAYPGVETIPLDTALHPEKLAHIVGQKDTVAVFGSSHSALLVLANLIDLPVKKVVNFYRSPHRYAVYMEDWILYDDIGLKGFTAHWAKKHLDGKLPEKLDRVLVSDPTFDESLALCNKAVYAIGFERRKLPVLEQYEKLHYDDRTGIIAPGLFGCGIAFPQARFNKIGHLEHRVGLWKFMDYLNSIIPIWIKYSN